ncbi:uncharacterized protein LOC128246799 [Mya arenaria]|uniref:uncharacterized protein LOC128246799 n=1 Tax=Mya arenaria TaxID=6604 RepID=UPI0022E667C4|nr:uncharacterized protein LOC128246799 [Mya arenaria]
METERRGNELLGLDIGAIFDAILDDDLNVVKHGIIKGFTAVTKRPETGHMALHCACFNSKLQVLELLKSTLKEGDINRVNVEEDNSISATALHMSMDGQVDTEVVKLLLDWGADPDARDKKGSTVLHELIDKAWDGFDEGFELESMMWEDISDSTEDESHEHIDETQDELMSSTGSDSKYRGRNSRIGKMPGRETNTRYTNTRVICDRENIVKEHEDNIDLNMDMENMVNADELGTSYFEKLKLLHKYKADINLAHSGTTVTPIDFWFHRFSWSMSEYKGKSIPQWCVLFFEAMVECGANVNIPNFRGETALVCLTQRHYKPDDAIFRTSYHYFVRRVLAECDSYENKDTLYDRSLLHDSVKNSNIILLEELVKHYSHVNMADKFGMTPLHLSTHNVTIDEHVFVKEMIICLMQHGGDINVVDNHGATPLHHAVSLRNNTAIEVLFSFGALPDVKDKHDRTAKDLAKIIDDGQALKLLGAGQCDEYTANESGVSDIRFGLFDLRCCHWQHVDVKQEFQQESQPEPDDVFIMNIDSWLKRSHICVHKRRAVLQNCTAALKQNTQKSNLFEENAKLMRQKLYDLAEMAAREIAKINPMFECKVLFGGSTTEGTKIGSCDEFDLVFDLFKLRQYLHLEEKTDKNLSGFVNLKVTNLEIFTTNGIVELVDENGYLKRRETSNLFHKYLEKSLNKKDLWTNNSYYSFWGTTNVDGECFNIGQVNLVWYGPFLKRQDVSVDIAPVFRVADWLPSHWNDNTTVVDTETARSIGCYLMMKDAKRYVENKMHPDDVIKDMTAFLNAENLLFKVSISQVEHAAMKYLPFTAKLGYKIAKSLRMLCPSILFDPAMDLGLREGTPVDGLKQNGKLCIMFLVTKVLTSYSIKTGLFHELESRGARMEFSPEEMQSDNWNRSVLSCDIFDQRVPTHEELTEAKYWTLNIFKRINAIVAEKKYLPEYFLLGMEATKLPGRPVHVISAFIKCLIYFLEHLETPADLVEMSKSLV